MFINASGMLQVCAIRVLHKVNKTQNIEQMLAIYRQQTKAIV